MSKLPARRQQRALRKVEKENVEVVEPPAVGNPWLSFRYSYTEVSAHGSTARVRLKSARYEGGKLSAEAFEGELDRGAYDRMMADAQRFFLDQTAGLLRTFITFLPLPGKLRGRND